MALALLLWLLSFSLSLYSIESSIRYITYVNSVYNGGICYSIASAAWKNIEVEILGLGALENYPIAKLLEEKNATKMSSKVYAVYWYLHQSADTNNKTFADNDIVVFFDGADTLHINQHNKTTKPLMESFLKLERPHSIIFSAERNCHPRHPTTICNALSSNKWNGLSKNQSTFRFVNSGGWIARYHVAIRFVAKWIELLEQQPGKRDDQLAIHEYILRKETNISYGEIDVILDRNCTIFQTSHMTAFSMGDWETPEYDVNGPFMREDGVIYNSETSTYPLFLHFNGIKFFVAQPMHCIPNHPLWPSHHQHQQGGNPLSTGIVNITRTRRCLQYRRLINPDLPATGYPSRLLHHFAASMSENIPCYDLPVGQKTLASGVRFDPIKINDLRNTVGYMLTGLGSI